MEPHIIPHKIKKFLLFDISNPNFCKWHGRAYLAFFIFLLCSGAFLISYDSIGFSVLGIILVATASVQAFVLLHECGHGSFSKNIIFNTILGWVCGLICIIPFESWRTIHHGHHIWSGWKDLDPTTSQVKGDSPGGFQTLILEFCWKMGLPLPSFFYRFGIFWSFQKALKQAKKRTSRIKILANFLLSVILYLALVNTLPNLFLFKFFISYVISLVFLEGVMLSQHTHIPQLYSEGKKVKPHSLVAQVKFTRSIAVPRWVEIWILYGFNKHEEHHLHPTSSGSSLIQNDNKFPRTSNWKIWYFTVRTYRASQILYNHEAKTGWKL